MFFQAEDGIRDIGVTVVQTCALPICSNWKTMSTSARAGSVNSRACSTVTPGISPTRSSCSECPANTSRDRKSVVQGKSVDLGGRRIIKQINQTMYGHALKLALVITCQ